MRQVLLACTLCFHFLTGTLCLSKGLPWLRTDDKLEHLKRSPNGRFLSYVTGGNKVRILDLKSYHLYLVSENPSATSSFVWSPFSQRLFYREMFRDKDKVRSSLKAFDLTLQKSVPVNQFDTAIGFLNLSPYDVRIRFLDQEGQLHSEQLRFPNNRLAKWQKMMLGKGSWIVDAAAVFWSSFSGKSLRPVFQSRSENDTITSFDVSLDGTAIAWSTKEGFLYKAFDGQEPILLGVGRDPVWHPYKKSLAFAGARLIGKAVHSYDLRVIDSSGRDAWLTHTQDISERWPVWTAHNNDLLYTIENTTDLFFLALEEDGDPKTEKLAKQ